MKLKRAGDLKRGMRVSIDGYLLEVVRVTSTAHAEPTVMILFLNGRAIVANVDEDFLIAEDD